MPSGVWVMITHPVPSEHVQRLEEDFFSWCDFIEAATSLMTPALISVPSIPLVSSVTIIS